MRAPEPSFTREGRIILTEELITWARTVLPRVINLADDARYAAIRTSRSPRIPGRATKAYKDTMAYRARVFLEEIANGLSRGVGRSEWAAIMEVLSYE